LSQLGRSTSKVRTFQLLASGQELANTCSTGYVLDPPIQNARVF